MIDKEMAIKIVKKVGSYGDIVLRSDMGEVAKFIDYQGKEIERLRSIIKEARKYIQDRYDGEVLTHTFDKDNVKELLEILERVGEEIK